MATLLDTHMKRLSVGEARLAKLVNSINGSHSFIHRSTLRNWRTGKATRANNWRQLATVAVALELNRSAADELLRSGGCPTIKTLTASALESDEALLSYWHVDNVLSEVTSCTGAANSEESTAQKIDVQADTVEAAVKRGNQKVGPSRSPNWKVLATGGLLGMACLATVTKLSEPIESYFSAIFDPKDAGNLLVNSDFEHGHTGWKTYVNEEAEADMQIIDGAMHIQFHEPGDKDWHIQLHQKNLQITASKIYTIDFRARSDEQVKVAVDITRVKNGKTSLIFESKKPITVTGDWSDYSMEVSAFDTQTIKQGGARLLFNMGRNEKGLLVLDNIELFEGTRTVRLSE